MNTALTNKTFDTRLIIRSVISFVIFAGMLFFPAGTLLWGRAWIFLGVVTAASIAMVAYIVPGNRELLEERNKFPIQKGQTFADKVLVTIFLLSFLAEIIFIPLDVFRYHLLGETGMRVALIGMFLFLAGWGIISLALKENRFAVLVVKDQKERAQTVIDTGVYGIVRHPMYSGTILFLLGMALWLGSYAAALLTIVPCGLLMVRIEFEERFLVKELEGYEAYTKRTRYRLMPFVW